MKVINIIEEGKLGGPQVRMVRVASALDAQVETLVVMPEASSDSFQNLCESSGVSYRTLPLTKITKDWRAGLRYVLFSAIEVWRLGKLFRRERVELVHASGGSWQFKGVIAARLASVPSVWHLNDTSMPAWVRTLFRVVQPLANGFIFASHRSRAYYDSLISGARPVGIVPATVGTEHFDPAVEVAGDEEALFDFGDAPVVGTVANINPIKGLETLIRAIGVLRKQHPGLRLVVVGPLHVNQRRYGERLAQLAAEQGVSVDWLGARSDVRPLLRRFDVYACSSLAESSPVSVWEAMAMARPVVSTDVGDVALHAQDGESGYIVSVGDADAMAERIGRLLGDPALRRQMGREARKAASAFSPEVIAAKTHEMYERVLGTDRTRATQEANEMSMDRKR